MRRLFGVTLLVLLALGPAAARIRIVTTTPDLTAIARAVGGERVEVTSIARGYQDPHYLQAKPSYMHLVNRADLLIYTGLELEVGWLPLLIQGARNPKVIPGERGHLEAAHGIRVLEVPTGEVDRTMGDIHPEGNPHYMLNPHNGLVVAETIAARLGELNPGNAAVFDRNLEQFRQGLGGKISHWEKRMKAFRDHKLVAYHKQWEYLADWLGLKIVDYIEDKAGIPPSPRHIANLVTRIPAEGVEAVVCANYVDPAQVRRVAEKTGVEVVVLPISVDGEEGIETYADLFEGIVTRLEDALK